VNTSTLLDAWMREYDYDASAADNAAVRVKGLDCANEVSDEWWMEFDGGEDFQYRNGNVSLLENTNSIAAPSDFYKCGDKGGLYITVASGDVRRLTYLPQGELRRMQLENGTAEGIPVYYTVFAMDGVTDLIPEFHFDIIANTSYNVTVDYIITPPVLTDATTTASNLHLWPVMYHTTLLKGVRARGARIMGDTVRQPQHEAEFQQAKALAMSKRRHGQDDDERTSRGGYSAYRSY
jgi:hypothetical protein